MASYSIAIVLLIAVVAVAWLRSRERAAPPSEGATAGAVPSETPAAETRPAGGEAGPPPASLGSDVYATQCRGCHGEGEARGRTLPALRGNVVTILGSEGGRAYLIDLLLDGRVRRVEGGETTYAPTHPDYAALSDAEVASVLNHMLTSWGNDALVPQNARPYTSDEIAARR